MNINIVFVLDIVMIFGILFFLVKDIWEFVYFWNGIEDLDELIKIEGIIV